MPDRGDLPSRIHPNPGDDQQVADGGGDQQVRGETIEDVLAEYRELVRSGNASRTANREFALRLEQAGFEGGADVIRAALSEVFDAVSGETSDPSARTAQEIQDDLVAAGQAANTSFADQQDFNIFDVQEQIDPGGVFTRFLNEQLGTASSFLRSGAERQSGNLFNRFTTGQLGGLAGLGAGAEQFAGNDPALFFDFLQGQGPGGFNEPNLSTALQNISGVFGGEGTTPGALQVNDFFRSDNGLVNQGRVGGAIGSNLLGSISPFLRSSFQGGIGDQLNRLLASNPDANPFAAFQRGGFF